MDDFALVCRKKIDDLGRIVIPKDIRKMLFIQDGEMLNVSVSEKGVLISKMEMSEDIVSSLTQTLYRICKAQDMSQVQKDTVTQYLEDAIRAAKGDSM